MPPRVLHRRRLGPIYALRPSLIAAAGTPMDARRHRRSPGSDRFLGIFSSPPATSSPISAAGDELDEDDIFAAGSEALGRHPSPKPSHSVPSAAAAGGIRRPAPDRNFGILAALPEDEEHQKPLIRRKASVAMSAAASPSTSPSNTLTPARMIPAIPKARSDFALSVPAGKIYQQSAPVNVPVRPPARPQREWGEIGGGGDGRDEDDEEEDEMLPPHEIVARAARRNEVWPMTTSSVLEGAGRTLKGSDLRRVRNAVLRKTGFLD